MTAFFLHYNFLTLALLFALPGAVIWLVRHDLRRTIICVVPFALPFAFTEFLFYPSYWEPNFLFDLGQRIGFGIEDFIFVCGLAAFSSTAYAFAFNRRYKPTDHAGLIFSALRALGLFVFSGLLFLGAIIAGVAVIYAACFVMVANACVILALRRDLAIPALLGSCLSTAIYFLLSLAAEKLLPGLFKNVWHTKDFLNIFIAGVPVEELLYGFSAGFIGTIFYPYVFGRRFIHHIANEGL